MDQTNKRWFFRRATIATLAAAGLAAGLGANTWAQGGPGYGPPPGRGMMQGPGYGPSGPGAMRAPVDPAQIEKRIERRVRHFAVEVDATPEQTGKLVEIAKSAARELQPMRLKMVEARKRGAELLSAPTVDRAAIERLRSEQIQAADAASKRFSQSLADAAEVLTPEQRKKFAEHLRHWGGGHRGGPWHRG